MTRRLIDYRKLDHNLAALLIETYPYGYGDEDIITFKNINGDYVEAVELKTTDTLYLVKISKSLSNFIANFEENVGKELESSTPEEIMSSEDMTNALHLNFENEHEQELD
ncbi:MULTISPECIES: hypothetical protein [Maribacter]|uniref:Uncharacterized protein n=1 Tax=Maribacter dokdonensis TaxID=320912 RepID=A0A1H4RSR7_9FLAO|nr:MULTISPECIES: hypothetical protein [Maribacter]HAI37187.1 hypothetical protein [Maribacter sp.]MBU2901899.1 hypothetical protein [Maribacter dokdonensis]PHN92090.1 hypothetical protein CSC80_13995 [Maribacter sp. 6B07]CAG2532296.1 hypothetical protein MAR621_02394 [Maribacter dokdonensis]SDS52898.1 hypothetical protein SAMN05192545_1560 [Maribacter dokdonensis]|tara:strand:+ start:212 stop:541 length:330 start_codon:yes stop_codon:yes gene_type:complete